MGKTILYSAVSDTDPISNNRDASMLHICRKYMPDKVVLFLSEAMCKIHQQDNRFVKALEKFVDEYNDKHKNESEYKPYELEIELLEQTDLTSAHDLDAVYEVIKENIQAKTSTMNDDDTLIVNISSGTPAMKYTLQFIATIGKYKIVPVLVASPNPDRTQSDTEKSDSSINSRGVWSDDVFDKIWDTNYDNDDSKYIDRCKQTTNMAMLSDFYKITLTEFVNNYNYSAALTLIESMPMLSTPKLKEILEGANARLQLQIDDAVSKFAKTDFKFPYNDDKKEVFEYALSLGIKLKKNEIADFVRAVTPLMTDLYIRTIKSVYNIDIADYVTDRSGCMRWYANKLHNSKLDTILRNCYNGNFRYGSPVYNIHLRNILQNKIDENQANNTSVAPSEAELLTAVTDIGEFENKIRNQTAHTMVSMTSSTVKRETGFTPEQIYDDIKKIMENNGISGSEWDSYDKMNKVIKDEISQYKK